MTNDLDTLLTALYVHLDDHVLPTLGWSRDHLPGSKPALANAELMCLATAQHLLGIASERRWIRYARTHLSGMFPRGPVRVWQAAAPAERAAGRGDHRTGPRHPVLA